MASDGALPSEGGVMDARMWEDIGSKIGAARTHLCIRFQSRQSFAPVEQTLSNLAELQAGDGIGNSGGLTATEVGKRVSAIVEAARATSDLFLARRSCEAFAEGVIDLMFVINQFVAELADPTLARRIRQQAAEMVYDKAELAGAYSDRLHQRKKESREKRAKASE